MMPSLQSIIAAWKMIVGLTFLQRRVLRTTTVVSLVVWLLASLSVHATTEQNLRGTKERRILAHGINGVPSVVAGRNLGSIGKSATNQITIHAHAVSAMKNVVRELGVDDRSRDFEGKGEPYIEPTGKAHIRLRNVVDGESVDGGSIVMHTAEDGTVTAVNGEIVTPTSFIIGPMMNPLDALKIALIKEGLKGGEFVDNPELKLVRHSKTGNVCRAWKASYYYETRDGMGNANPHRDEIYADAWCGMVRSTNALLC